MLLTIHNLPISTRYSDVKTLIQSRCGLSEILLDNLVNEGQYKKVTLGVAEEEDAAIVVRQINGLYIDGAHLYVEKVRQKKQTEQPYRTGNFDKSDSQTNRVDQPGAQNVPNYPGSMNVPYSNMPYNQPLVNQEMVQMMVAQHMMGMGMGMYYVPQQMTSPKNDFPGSSDQVNPFQYNQRDPNTGSISNEYYQQAHNKKPCKDDEYANYDDTPQSYGRPIDEKDQKYNHDLYNKRHHEFNRSDDVDHNPNQLNDRYQGFNRNDYDQNQSYGHSPENQHSSRQSRWSREEMEDYQEARSGRSRSRSPYIIESRKTSSFENRYEQHEDNYYRRNSDRPLDPSPQRYHDRNENTSRDHNQRPYRTYDEPKSNRYRDNIQSDNQSVRENGNQSFGRYPENRRSSRQTRWSREKGEDYQETGPSKRRSRSPYITESRKISPFENRYERHEDDYHPPNSDRPMDPPPQRYGDRNENSSRGYNQRADRAYQEPKDNRYRDNFKSDNQSIDNKSTTGREYYEPRQQTSSTYRSTGSLVPNKPLPRAGSVSPKGVSPLMSDIPPRPREIPSQLGNVRPRGNASSNDHVAPNTKPQLTGITPTAGSENVPKKQRIEVRIRRDTSFRHEAAAKIGKEAFAKFHHDSITYDDRQKLFKSIKRAIYTRIELLLGTTIGLAKDEIISRYRKQFPPEDDLAYIKTIHSHWEAEMALEKAEAQNKITNTIEIKSINKTRATTITQKISIQVVKEDGQERRSKIIKREGRHLTTDMSDKRTITSKIRRSRLIHCLKDMVIIMKTILKNAYPDNGGQGNPPQYNQRDQNTGSMSNQYSPRDNQQAKNKPRKDNNKPQSYNRPYDEEDQRYNRDPYDERDQGYNRPDDADPRHDPNQPDERYQGFDRYDDDRNQSYDHYQENQHPRRETRWSRRQDEDYQEAGPSRNRSRSPHITGSRNSPSFENRYPNRSERHEDGYRQPNSNRPIDPPPQRYGDRNENNSRGYNQRGDRAYQEPKDNRYRENIQSDNRSIPQNKPKTGREYYEPRQQTSSTDRVPHAPDKNQPSKKRPYPDSDGSELPPHKAWRERFEVKVENNSETFTRKQTANASASKGTVPNRPPLLGGNPPPRGIPPLMGNAPPRGIPPLMGNVRPRGNAPPMGNVRPRANAPAMGNVRPRANAPPNSNFTPRPSAALAAILPLLGIAGASGNELSKTQKKYKKKGAKQYEAQIRRDTTWRQQAAAEIGKVVYSKFRDDSMTTENKTRLFKAIKTATHTRIELLLGTEMGVPVPDIISRYRKQFPTKDDLAYLAAVRSHVEAEIVLEQIAGSGSALKTEKPGNTVENKTPGPKQEKDNASSTNKGSTGPTTEKGTTVPTTANPTASSTGKTAVPAPGQSGAPIIYNITRNKNLGKVAAPPASGKLPNYPQADKGIHRACKQQQKREFDDENIYKCDPHIMNALDKELDKICHIFKDQFNPANPAEVTVCEQLGVNSLIVFRKSLKLTTIKRILDIRTNLTIRIYFNGKIPPPALLSDYLRPFKVISLKKSKQPKTSPRPFYVATCKDYKGYDELLTMGSMEMYPGTTLLFKPLHLTPPKPKFNKNDYKIYNRMFQKGANTEESTEEPSQDDNENIAEKKDEEIFYEDIPDVGPKNETDYTKDDFCMIGGQEYKVQDEVYETK